MSLSNDDDNPSGQLRAAFYMRKTGLRACCVHTVKKINNKVTFPRPQVVPCFSFPLYRHFAATQKKPPITSHTCKFRDYVCALLLWIYQSDKNKGKNLYSSKH